MLESVFFWNKRLLCAFITWQMSLGKLFPLRAWDWHLWSTPLVAKYYSEPHLIFPFFLFINLINKFNDKFFIINLIQSEWKIIIYWVRAKEHMILMTFSITRDLLFLFLKYDDYFHLLFVEGVVIIDGKTENKAVSNSYLLFRALIYHLSSKAYWIKLRSEIFPDEGSTCALPLSDSIKGI